MGPDKPASYLVEAEKCEAEAQRATVAEVRAAYQALAERWRALARQANELRASAR